MLCSGMREYGGRLCPCGQCMPCRINKKRMWTGRILLEAQHSPCESTFLTLTYNPQHEPENRSVVKTDLQGFINRLRHRSNLGPFRYFGVGEYGDKNKRPHYHMAIFGNPPELIEQLAKNAWKENGQEIGFIQVGTIEKASASYIAGYCTKKLTSKNDERLYGREPEFAIMSKFPPLGAAGVNHIFDLLHTRTGAAAIADRGDVPHNFAMFGKQYPLGTYWINHLRKEMGITNPPVKAAWDMDLETFIREQQDAEKIAVKLWNTERTRKTRNPIPDFTPEDYADNILRLQGRLPDSAEPAPSNQ